jgi:transcriptional regulator with XRE-family HTH domain
MDLESFRKSRGLTQQQLATAVGLRSKSYISRLETGAGPPASLRLALRIERFSDGLVSASSLCPDAEPDLTVAAPAEARP